MSINFSGNNYSKQNVSFGHFEFWDASKNLLKRKIKTSKDLVELKSIVGAERNRDREIVIDTNDKGNRLLANLGGGWNYSQGIFQSPLGFLKEIVKKADKYEANKAITNTVNEVIDNL